MSPKAEIWLPRGISQEDLEGSITSIGGRVLGFEKTSSVEKVLPWSLAEFLGVRDPSLQFGQTPTYSSIFSRLRSLPRQEQEELLMAFYTEGVEGFPNGGDLGKTLAEINNIPWFKPERDPEIALLQGLVNESYLRLNLPPLPVKIIREDWEAARDVAGKAWKAWKTWEAAWAAAWKTSAVGAGPAAGAAAWAAAWDGAAGAAEIGTAEMVAAWGAAQIAAQTATWVVVEDLMPQRGFDKGNPHEPLIEIYGLGCWPIGKAPERLTRKKFVIFVPSAKAA